MTIKHLFPPGRPSLDLNFANSRTLDPRVTFTRSSTGTYVDADGIIQTAAADEPRFDHDGNGECLGLLLEEARTNLFDQSEDVGTWTSPVWTNTNNVAISPDGTQNAGSVVPDVGVTTQSTGRNVTISNTGDYTCSVFAKANGLTQLKLRNNTTAPLPRADFTLTGDGTASTVDGTASIEKYPNGWFRCIFTTNLDTTGTVAWEVGTAEDAAASDGVNGFYVWNMQVEAGSFPSSCIPTAGSTVTRSADVVEVTGNNFSSWYSQSEGSFLLAAPTLKATMSNKFVVATNSSVSNDEGINFWNASGVRFRLRIFKAGNIEADILGDLYEGANYGWAYKTDDSALFKNGTLEGSDTSCQMPTAAIKLQIGNNGLKHIARLAYYPYKLSDEQLEALTS